LVWGIGRWFGAAILIMLVWQCLYHFLPNLKRPFRMLSAGSVAGVVLWLAASRGLVYYTDNFGNYDKTYGALGGVIVFLTWLWLSCLALLVGGELDGAIEKVRAGPEVFKEVVIMERERPAGREPAITDLARRVGDDLSMLAKDHFELARIE